jgi:hypothetical protein
MTEQSTTLTPKQRDDVASLLDAHQKVCDAIDYGGRANWYSNFFVSNEQGDEFFEVSLQWSIVKSCLVDQKHWLEAELKKHGIEIR